MARGEPQIKIRIPDDMLQAIAAAANANVHSMNAEVVSRIRKSLADDQLPHDTPMTLRDYAALVALPAVINTCSGDAYRIATYPSPEAYFAAKAYGLADAMLKAREPQS